jgi:hypothetical protein
VAGYAYTALDAGREFAQLLRDRGVEPWTAGALPRPLEMLERAGTRHERFPTPTRRTVGAPDRDHPDRMMKLLEGE